MAWLHNPYPRLSREDSTAGYLNRAVPGSLSRETYCPSPNSGTDDCLKVLLLSPQPRGLGLTTKRLGDTGAGRTGNREIGVPLQRQTLRGCQPHHERVL